MPKVNEMFPSKWLAAADFDEDDNGNPVDMVLTIEECRMEDMEIPGQDSIEKPVVFFKELEKGLVLNKTNSKTIAAMYGNDTDDWENERITLFATEVNFQGTMTPCIRVRAKAPKKAVRPTLRQSPSELTPKNPGPLVKSNENGKAKPARDDDDREPVVTHGSGPVPEDIPF